MNRAWRGRAVFAALADGTRITAGVTVTAAGCWSADLVCGLDVRKRKGHLVITDRHPGFARHQLVELGYLKSAHSLTSDSVAFNIQPRQTGQMLIGSSRQYGAEQTEVDSKILSRMIERALEFMPPERLIAAPDCGMKYLPRQRAFRKLQAMVEGAALV